MVSIHLATSQRNSLLGSGLRLDQFGLLVLIIVPFVPFRTDTEDDEGGSYATMTGCSRSSLRLLLGRDGQGFIFGGVFFLFVAVCDPEETCSASTSDVNEVEDLLPLCNTLSSLGLGLGLGLFFFRYLLSDVFDSVFIGNLRLFFFIILRSGVVDETVIKVIFI